MALTPPAADAHDRMIEENFDALQKMLPTLMQKEAGRYALMRDCKLVETFTGATDAQKYASVIYDDDNYSVHKITDAPVVVPTVWRVSNKPKKVRIVITPPVGPVVITRMLGV
ncbi:MAG: hypothetical protein GDA50_05780 [Alphaproteobacteria bacterium GM202ARS2]|nr:hypothetical protein [Alphaproteobacteria bacterium GM202ARS2]